MKDSADADLYRISIGGCLVLESRRIRDPILTLPLSECCYLFGKSSHILAGSEGRRTEPINYQVDRNFKLRVRSKWIEAR
jgi:hypothetical protein